MEMGGHPVLTAVFASGPLARMQAALDTHCRALTTGGAALAAVTLAHPQVPPPYRIWFVAHECSSLDWARRVNGAILGCFRLWCREGLRSHPRHLQSYFDTAVQGWRAALPRYLRLGGHLAPIGLRFKGLSLRTEHPSTSAYPCIWCSGPALELGGHWLSCPHLPAAASDAVTEARSVVAAEAGWALPAAEPRVDAALSRLAWPRQTSDSTRTVLRAMALIVDSYRAGLPASEWAQFPPSRV
jgi:hypothetical protein